MLKKQLLAFTEGDLLTRSHISALAMLERLEEVQVRGRVKLSVETGENRY